METLAVKTKVLETRGTSSPVVEELMTCNHSLFDGQGRSLQAKDLPLAHIATWQEYLPAAKEHGVFNPLVAALVQLQFPIQAGTSNRMEYRFARRKGQAPPQSSSGLKLTKPEQLKLFIHNTLAAAVSVIIPNNRVDFVALAQTSTNLGAPAFTENTVRMLRSLVKRGAKNLEMCDRAYLQQCRTIISKVASSSAQAPSVV